MAENYILLERTELNAAAASVTFSNIPQTGYTDLKIVVSARSDRASVVDDLAISFNGNTASFTGRELYGDGSSAASITTARAAGTTTGANATANTFGNSEIYIPNYTGSANKSFSVDGVQETNATAAYAELYASLWSNTAAITSIGFAPLSGTNLLTGSTFSLYGIAALGTTPAIAPKASGGNRIDNDGTYWYHTFTSSGSFVPQTGLTADVLVIAGGGGGGELGGGGGAGGLLAYASQSLANGTNYSCTIGAGGAGTNNTGGTSGVSGSNSTFQGLTAASGGGGGGRYDSSGLTGGSGGGAGRQFVTAATGTSGQGNNGGVGIASYASSAAGGGGAGAVGANATNPNGGAGGIGSNTYSSWASATSTGVSGYYAGGGGGGSIGATAGAGGTGGGGTGSIASGSFGSNGTVNTGGGAGGGSGGGSTGGTGGSGIIIVRYTIA
jgi:hypothetical protein